MDSSYYQRNKERIRVYQRAYRAAHPEKTKAQNVKWQTEHAEEKKAYDAAYKAAHRERSSKLATQWCKDHPERHREQSKKWRNANLEKAKASSRKTYAKSAGKRVEYRKRNKKRLIQYERDRYAKDCEALKEKSRKWRRKNPHKAKQHKLTRRSREYGAPVLDIIRVAQWETEWRTRHLVKCVYCLGYFAPKKCETDHVIPLSRPEDGGIHGPANVVISCIRCNRSKHDKLLSEWIPSFTPQPGSLCLNQNS